MTIDTIYSKEQSVKDFVFDEKVVQVFPDMVKRSVPGYPTIVSTMGKLAARYATPNSIIYDLGTSLGAVAFSINRELPGSDSNIEIHAVDSSRPMVNGLCKLCDQTKDTRIVPIENDILEMPLYESSVICMNLVLQFIDVNSRHMLLSKVYDSLQEGGAFLISEKFIETDNESNQDLRDLHHDFKAAQGYSPIEIEQKAKSISKAMPIETIEHRKEQLLGLGFSRVYVWYQCFNFYSMVAVK